MKAQFQALKTPLHVRITESGRVIYEKVFQYHPIVIGRSLHCDIPLPQFTWISREHATIAEEGGEVYISDMNSSHGLVVNGQNLERIKVRSGMRIQVGPLNISFELVGEAQEPARTDTVTIPEVTKTDVTTNPTGRSLKIVKLDEPIGQTHTVTSAGVEMVEERHIRREPASRTPGDFSFGDGEKNRALNMSLPYESAKRLSRRQRALQAHVSWKGRLIDSRVLTRGSALKAGPDSHSIFVPVYAKPVRLVSFEQGLAKCYLTTNMKGRLIRPSGVEGFDQALSSGAIPKRWGKHVLTLEAEDVCVMEFPNDMSVYLRYVPAPRALSKSVLFEPDEIMRKSAMGSFGFHGLVALILILMQWFGPSQDAPKIRSIPPRAAKLLVKKKAPPPEIKKPPPKEIAKPKVEPQKHREVVKAKPKPIQKPKTTPKKVIVKPNQKLKELNQEVSKNIANQTSKAAPQKDIKEIGALAALGALSTTASGPPSNQPVSINVNPNAGGMKGSTGGLIGTIKSKGGRLTAGGMASVKTEGKGYGTGTGYGVQGIKGQAGSRGVAGAVVGIPRLMKIKDTEGLTHKQVMDVISKNVYRIQQCYERSLLSDPGIAGRVEYEWQISPQGRVQWAKVKSSEVSGGDSLNNCVRNVIEGLKFPVAKNGRSTIPSIGFPFGRQ